MRGVTSGRAGLRGIMGFKRGARLGPIRLGPELLRAREGAAAPGAESVGLH